jgi:hypothetical protein
MSSETVQPLDLTKIPNDTELLAHAPAILAPHVKSFFSRYQLFFYGFLTGAATVVVSKMAYSAVKERY